MKLLIILLCLIISLVDFSEASGLAYKIHQVCQKKTGVSDEDIQKGQKGILDVKNINLACYMKCILNKAFLMDDDGVITPQKAMKFLPPGAALKFAPGIAMCGTVEDSDTCLKAMKIYICILKEFPTAYFLP